MDPYGVRAVNWRERAYKEGGNLIESTESV
jgi:hypothetical protein